jgi:hypothetical protein
MAEQRRLERVSVQADEITERLGLSTPVDPFDVIESEQPFLKAGGGDLGNRYDGKLEYERSKNRFLLFFNTKYDRAVAAKTHHPRTRFSIAHELGHYFIEAHRAYLMRPGAKTHASQSEFRTGEQMEREADAFASTLLLPTKLVKPLVNAEQLSVPRLCDIAGRCGVSLTCAMFRSVRLSHFPCAVAAIREGAVAWTFVSEALIENGLYPKRGHLPRSAKVPFAEHTSGKLDKCTQDGMADEWFETYGNQRLSHLCLLEEYVPAPFMDSLLVLLTLDEQDLITEDDEVDDDD